MDNGYFFARKETVANDGVLSIRRRGFERQLYAHPLSARLVIQSACKTGMGDVVSANDLPGLARSFYLGGASSVVSSPWSVDDEATRVFMETFH